MPYITDKELDALQGAVDFIENRADGAEDYTIYQEMMDGLRSVWQKGMKHRVAIKNSKLVKKYLKKLQTINP